ncbi:MAG TPA: hypothetical protein VGL58_00295 [Caulobacteraceae bacterium]|jgi:hypothetical protein
MNRALIIILASAALAGCETGGGGAPGPSSGPMYAPNSGAGAEAFRAEDFAWSQASGGGEVDGVVAYKTGYTCTGGTVVLTPETPWSRARMRTMYNSDSGSAMSVGDVHPAPAEHATEYQQYARRTTCDANNAFRFTGLPSGAWFVVTVATPTGGGDKVAIMRRVVTNGGVVSLKLQ